MPSEPSNLDPSTDVTDSVLTTELFEFNFNDEDFALLNPVEMEPIQGDLTNPDTSPSMSNIFPGTSLPANNSYPDTAPPVNNCLSGSLSGLEQVVEHPLQLPLQQEEFQIFPTHHNEDYILCPTHIPSTTTATTGLTSADGGNVPTFSSSPQHMFFPDLSNGSFNPPPFVPHGNTPNHEQEFRNVQPSGMPIYPQFYQQSIERDSNHIYMNNGMLINQEQNNFFPAPLAQIYNQEGVAIPPNFVVDPSSSEMTQQLPSMELTFPSIEQELETIASVQNQHPDVNGDAGYIIESLRDAQENQNVAGDKTEEHNYGQAIAQPDVITSNPSLEQPGCKHDHSKVQLHQNCLPVADQRQEKEVKVGSIGRDGGSIVSGMNFYMDDMDEEKTYEEDKRKVPCPQCTLPIFPTNLPRHIHNVHIGKVLYRCEEHNCGFTSKKAWHDHLRGVHNEKTHRTYSAKSFKCDMCDYESVQRCNLSRHKTNMHGVGKPLRVFTCEHCGKKCKTKANLKSHEHNCIERAETKKRKRDMEEARASLSKYYRT